MIGDRRAAFVLAVSGRTPRATASRSAYVTADTAGEPERDGTPSSPGLHGRATV